MRFWFPMLMQFFTWIFFKYNPLRRPCSLWSMFWTRCHHKRQYRFYTWNHFLDEWSKAICKAFDTGCGWLAYDQTGLFLMLANWNYFKGPFLYCHHYLLIRHCLCFLNHHLTNPALHWKKNILKNFITHCECLSLMFLKKIYNFNLSIWW